MALPALSVVFKPSRKASDSTRCLGGAPSAMISSCRTWVMRASTFCCQLPWHQPLHHQKGAWSRAIRISTEYLDDLYVSIDMFWFEHGWKWDHDIASNWWLPIHGSHPYKRYKIGRLAICSTRVLWHLFLPWSLLRGHPGQATWVWLLGYLVSFASVRREFWRPSTVDLRHTCTKAENLHNGRCFFLFRKRNWMFKIQQTPELFVV